VMFQKNELCIKSRIALNLRLSKMNSVSSHSFLVILVAADTFVFVVLFF